MTTPELNRLNKSTTLKASGRCIIDWNLNRHVNITTVKNPLIDASSDSEEFPVASVVLPHRPTAGIVKAMTSDSGYPTVGRAGGTLKGSSIDRLSYTSSKDSAYTYWLSPDFSTSTLYLGAAGHYSIENAQIEVVYASAVKSNKIVIGFENTYVSPKHISLEVKVGSSWVKQDFANPTLDSGGRFVVYYQDSNIWGYPVNRDNFRTLSGVRLTVNAVNVQNARASVIEVSAHREEDVSDDIVNASTNDTISEASVFLPVGRASSNESDLALDNTSGKYREDSGEYAGLIERHARVLMQVNVHEPDVAPVESEWKNLFDKIVDDYSFDEITVGLSLKDSSVILQERKPDPFLLQNVSVTAIAVYLCHSVGFNRIQYDMTDLDPLDAQSIIKHYWVDPEKTVWEHFAELGESTQTAFYFDEYDVLQIKTRSAAFNLTRPTSWIYDGHDVSGADVIAQARPAGDSGKLADIIDLSETSDPEINSVTVQYSNTETAKVNRGYPVQEVAWEPTDTVVLRSSPLQNDIPVPGTVNIYPKIMPSHAATWPYEGFFQVNGEIIAYRGKEYVYYTASGTSTKKFIYSAEEKEALDALNEGFAWRNSFNGYLRVTPSQRGAKGTVATSHPRNGFPYTVSTRTAAFTSYGGSKYLNRSVDNGYAIFDITTRPGVSWQTRGLAKTTLGGPLDPKVYGTRIYFPESGYKYGGAGLAIGLGPNDSGFYVEIARTSVQGARTRTNEMNVIWKNTAGVEVVLGDHKGAKVQIVPGQWYDLDVMVSSNATHHTFLVYLNGVLRHFVTVLKSSTKSSLGRSAGFFVRWSTRAYFDYFFATAANYSEGDPMGYFDLAHGGYRSAVLKKEISSNAGQPTRKPPSTNPKLDYDQQVRNSFHFSEFGTIAHEVRDFDVQYETKPAVSSMLYLSNESQVTCTNFVSSPTSAKFTLVNTARVNAVVSGEDTLTYGVDNSVEQKMLVYGRMITVDEQKSVTAEDKAGIIRAGKNEFTVESEWIQSEAHAKRISDWIINSDKNQTFDVSVFANPYIQLLDTVAIQDSERGMSWANYKCFVTSKRVEYDGTLKVDLGLRRAV